MQWRTECIEKVSDLLNTASNNFDIFPVIPILLDRSWRSHLLSRRHVSWLLTHSERGLGACQGTQLLISCRFHRFSSFLPPTYPLHPAATMIAIIVVIVVVIRSLKKLLWLFSPFFKLLSLHHVTHKHDQLESNWFRW